MNKFVIILVCLSAGGAVAAWQFGVFGGSDDIAIDDNVHTVTRGPLKITLIERGTLKAKKSTKIKCEVHGKLAWLAEEGAKVKKDDILIKMDTQQVQQQIDTLTSQITQGEAQLKSAETAFTVQEGQNETNREKAELAVEVADVELEKYLESDHPARLRNLDLAIEDAEVQKNRAEIYLEGSAKLLEEDFVTQQQHEQDKLALKKAINGLVTANMKKDSYLKYEQPIEEKRKRAAVVEAGRGLIRARLDASAKLNDKKAGRTQRKLSLARTKQRHKREVEKIGKMILKAPTDGTVLIGDPDNPWNNERIKVGQQVWRSMTLITLPDSRELAVVIQVHEADIAKLKKGMKAFVKSETLKGEIFDAEITKIDTVANAGRRWGGDSVKRFKVELSLVGEGLDLKTGTSAEVEVQVEELPDVLTVPSQAIHAKEDKYFCYLRRGGKAVRVRVDPGRANESFASIKFGLEEGDEVLLSTPETYDVQEDGPEWKPYLKKKEKEEKAKKKAAEEAKKKKAEERKKKMEEMRKKMMEKAKKGGKTPGKVPSQPPTATSGPVTKIPAKTKNQ